MAGDGTKALVINSGSSSVKYGLFVTKGPGLELLCSGLCDKIGLDGSTVSYEDSSGKTKTEVPLKDHGQALARVAMLLTQAGGPLKSVDEIKVVGHRVVHGGPKYSEPTVIDDAVYAEIEACVPLAPLHNPAGLLGIKMAQALFPTTQVAVFDTAFHGTMPPEAYRYALPKELFEKHNVRRYGFHGTSYKYVSAASAKLLGQPLERLNMIICHLGNGCSMACLKDGKVVDTTMGLTPLEGLVMGTRAGDIDGGVYTFLCENLAMKPKDVDTMLTKKSGMLGISGMSDMRDNIKAAAEGNPDAALARALYKERIRKYLGSYLVKLNGDLDALVFTAGVGEGDKALREMVCSGLESLGIEVDANKNRSLEGDGEIQTATSRAAVLVMHTEEELSIATQSLELTGFMKPADSVAIVPRTDVDMKPKQFMHMITDKAKANKQHIVLPEGLDARVVAAAGTLLKEGICTLTMLGNPDEIAKHAKEAGVDLTGMKIINPKTEKIDDMVDALWKERKEKGMTREKAEETLRGDLSWFGTMLMYMGRADGMVSGAAHATADTMRPALQVIKTAPGAEQVSSFFFMLLANGLKVFADSGLQVNPNSKELADIALATAASARAFNISPRIAMCSYVTGADKQPETLKTREATAIVKEKAPNELVEGPIQYDAAVNPFVAAQKFKGKNSAVAGKANVLIFPELNAGNIVYKATQQSSGCIAIGPVMQGLRLPVNDLSRGCTIDDIVATTVVTCLQSIDAKKRTPNSKL